jgi:hypothetical protein
MRRYKFRPSIETLGERAIPGDIATVVVEPPIATLPSNQFECIGVDISIDASSASASVHTGSATALVGLEVGSDLQVPSGVVETTTSATTAPAEIASPPTSRIEQGAETLLGDGSGALGKNMAHEVLRRVEIQFIQQTPVGQGRSNVLFLPGSFDRTPTNEFDRADAAPRSVSDGRPNVDVARGWFNRISDSITFDIDSSDRRYMRSSFNLPTPARTHGASLVPQGLTEQGTILSNPTVAGTVLPPGSGGSFLIDPKRIAPNREEFGPPGLSRIPYVNHLFMNADFVRGLNRLRLMVTPRIIMEEAGDTAS